MSDLETIIERLSETSNPIFFQYFKNLKNRTIVINDEVSENIIEMAVLPLLEMDNDGSGKDINILISSPGGAVYAGLTLCSVIDKLKCKTTITALSYVMSMGALITMAGFNNPNVYKKCYPFTVGLIHGGNQFIDGTSSQVKDFFNFNEKYEEKIKEYILTHSKITEKDYKKMLKSEWYMTAEDMVKYGIVQEIV